MNIIKKHLDPNQYYQEECEKTQIVLHHTVSSTFHSTFSWWQETSEHVGTSYVIDKNGDIYETFRPQYWAWHLGLGDISLEKKSIGIELVNESHLTKRENGDMYWLDNTAKYRSIHFEKEWRGHKYWATYSQPQFFATIDLVKHLTNKFNIEKNIITHHDYDKSLVDFNGIISHCNVRGDKTDLSPAFDLKHFNRMTFPEVKSINFTGE